MFTKNKNFTANDTIRKRKRISGLMLDAVNRLFKDKLAVLSFIIIIFVVTMAVFAHDIAPNDPTKVDLQHRLAPASAQYPLGTDHLGRCLLSRLIYGARVSLTTSILALFAIMIIGIPLGIIAGYYGGLVDNIIMRIVDILLAFPNLIFALVIAGILGPGLLNVMISVIAVWWVGYARVVRGMVLSIKEKEFILAAEASGTNELKIVIRHILPNVLSPVVVLATLEMGSLMLTISGLSFLGLGAQPPKPEWGAMLNDARPYMEIAPHLMIYPGICIMIVVLAFNFLGDGLRDALDPKEVIF
ncbi:nickel ABC transporter permease subunit NikC [Aceticella autotrophica]|uniref:Nickel ABC transporter permease subunit NikC n=1 Tax=Aceticella autotrophica TaxID=2755338 RepID=A0A975GA43_9THEO|nr:nickel ABC transporter permease subunit NikC [Aceticella autotrophica]QSZ26787.1 nickel ABC transporter permease subunit NikC [Aceticella autotrophica]